MTTKKAPVSMCMITRDDPHLEECIKSFIDYVEELCIVITSDKDLQSVEVAKKYNAKWLVFTDCNEDDRIVDFSLARNKSLSLATSEYIAWQDSDDQMVGGENIYNLINDHTKSGNKIGFIFPYEYSYDNKGAVSCRHYRERIVPRDQFHFVNPVHECLVAKPGVTPIQLIQRDDVVIKHRRQFNPKVQDPTRNLRILKNYFEKNPDSTDARQYYYIGLEYSNNNDPKSAIKYLTKYIEISGWADEKFFACTKLVDIYQNQMDYDNAIKYAFLATSIKDNWFEGYFALCRLYYFRSDWEKCAYFGKFALTRPATNTLLFVNTADRIDIHNYLNVALNNVGNVVEALESVNAGLEANPSQPELINNKKLYESFLGIKPNINMVLGNENKLGIVFVTATGLENWSPDTIDKSGCGGSEIMLRNMAKQLKKLGHNVVVYAAADGYFDDGVQYINVNKFRNIECDVLVVSRYANFIDDDFAVNAKLKLLWCHDVVAHNATNERMLKFDRILALTSWHKENLCKQHNLHSDHVLVTRNGIDLTLFDQKVKRDQFKIVNSSSPDRSWPVLLECFPEIKKQVPEATLHLFYGFHNWKMFAANDKLQMDLINSLEEKVTTMDGVVFHNRVNEKELATHFLSAGVWAFPTFWTETSCITAMQARKASCHIITSNLAALKESVKNYGILIDGEWTSENYKKTFIEEVVKALNSNKRIDSGECFDIKTLAKDWNEMFYKTMQCMKTNPIVPYQPTKRYARKKCDLVKLNIAAGTNVFPHDGWVNLDHADFSQYFSFLNNVRTSAGMPDHQKRLWEFIQEGGEIDFRQHDATKPFDFANDSVDLIYCGQMIEHLSPEHGAPTFLKECLRILKPTGVLKITTPDLNKLLAAHAKNEMSRFTGDQPAFYSDRCNDSQLSLIMFGSAGENCVQNNYEGHMFCYSENSIRDLLVRCGFKNIVFIPTNEILTKETVDAGMSHSLLVEATK